MDRALGDSRGYGGGKYGGKEGGGDNSGARGRRHVVNPNRRGQQQANFNAEEANLRRLRQYIITNDGLDDHLPQLVDVLKTELAFYNQECMDTILECASEMPLKTGVYATLVGLLNLDHHQFVADLVSAATVRFVDGLTDASPLSRHKSRLMLRFITLLVGVNVLEVGSLVKLLGSLVEAASEAANEAASGWQPHADYLIYCVLACLPWGGADLFERDLEALEQVLASVETYLGKRQRGSNHLLALCDIKAAAAANPEAAAAAEEDDENDEDFIEELWGRVSVLHEGGTWTVQSVQRFHASFEHRLAGAIHHDLPYVPLPAPMADSHLNQAQAQAAQLACYPPRSRLRVLAVKQTEGDRAPIERFVMEEYILDTLVFWADARAECVRNLASLPVPSSWNPEYLLAETLFAQMLKLPSSPNKVLLYGIVLADLCRLRTSEGTQLLPKMAPALASTVGALFRRVPTMDLECRSRMAEWLALHLSNFSFHWPWDRWAFVTELPDHAPQRIFVTETLQRMVRLSYWDRIHATLPDSLKAMMPPKPEPKSCYATEIAEARDEAGTEVSLAQELMGLIKGKVHMSELEAWVDETLLPAVRAETAVRVAGTCVLILCSKSWTHLVTLLERYGRLLKKVAPDRDMQQELVRTAAEIWVTSPQHLVITVGRLMSHRLVENTAIVDWVFSTWGQLLAGELPKEHVATLRTSLWEVLLQTVNKTVARTKDHRAELLKAEVEARQAQFAVQQASERAHQASMALQDQDKEEGVDHEAEREAAEAATAEQNAANDANITEATLMRNQDAAAEAETHMQEFLVHVYRAFVGMLGTDVVNPGDPEVWDIDEDAEIAKKKSEEKAVWVSETLRLLRVFGRMHFEEVGAVLGQLETDVFTPDVPAKVKDAAFEGISICAM